MGKKSKNDNYDEYRKQLNDLEKSVHESFDKTLITLSGGALATSIAFFKDIIGNNTPVMKELASYAWISWASSLGLLLMALYSGTWAYRYTIKKLDCGKLNNENPAGPWTYIIYALNAGGAITFILGLILFIIFAYKN